MVCHRSGLGFRDLEIEQGTAFAFRKFLGTGMAAQVANVVLAIGFTDAEYTSPQESGQIRSAENGLSTGFLRPLSFFFSLFSCTKYISPEESGQIRLAENGFSSGFLSPFSFLLSPVLTTNHPPAGPFPECPPAAV